MLDNHDDFGGHAKRNEFHHDGRMLLLNGGTLNIEAPASRAESMGLLRTLGIDIARFEKEIAPDHGVYQALQLRNGVWFNKEKFGTDRLAVGTPGGSADAAHALWAEFLAKTPLSLKARQDIARLQSHEQPDYMPGLTSDEKKRKLLHISYQDFLLNVAKADADAAWFYQTRSDGLFLLAHRRAARLLRVEHELPAFRDEPRGDAARSADPERAARTGARTRRVRMRPDGPFISGWQCDDRAPSGAVAHPGRRCRHDSGRCRVGSSELRTASTALPTPRGFASTAWRSTWRMAATLNRKGSAVTYAKGGKTYKVRGGSVVLACWNL